MQDKGQHLARAATPLTACVQRISCTSYRTLTPSAECHRMLDKANENWLPRRVGNVP